MPFDNPQPLPESETVRILVGVRERLSDRSHWNRSIRHSVGGDKNCLLGACERQIGINRPAYFDGRCLEVERPEVIEALFRFARPTARDECRLVGKDKTIESANRIFPMSWRIAMNNDIYGYKRVLEMLDHAIAYERKRAMLGETVGAEA